MAKTSGASRKRMRGGGDDDDECSRQPDRKILRRRSRYHQGPHAPNDNKYSEPLDLTARAPNPKTTEDTPPASLPPPESAFARFPHEVLVNILTFLLQRDGPVLLRSPTVRRWRNEIAALKLDDWQKAFPNTDPPRCPPYVLSSKDVVNDYKSIKSSLLSVLLVSRSFYFAGIESFYGSNTLEFRSAAGLAAFLDAIGGDRRKCIRAVAVNTKWYLEEDSREQSPGGTTHIDYRTCCKADEPFLRMDIFERLRPYLKTALVWQYEWRKPS